MSHILSNDVEQDENQNQFLNQHSNTHVVQRPHFFYNQSSYHAEHSHLRSSQNKLQLEENSLSKAIHNQGDSSVALQSKKEGVQEDNGQMQNEENEFMLDQNSLIESINKGIKRDQSGFDLRIKNSSNMLINKSHSNNPFKLDSKIQDENQRQQNEPSKDQNEYMGMESIRHSDKIQKNNDFLAAQSNQLINHSKYSRFHESKQSQQGQDNFNQREQTQQHHLLNESKVGPQSKMKSQINNYEDEESKQMVFLNNSFSMEDKKSSKKESQDQNQYQLDAFSQHIPLKSFHEEPECEVNLKSQSQSQIAEINNFTSNISSKEKFQNQKSSSQIEYLNIQQNEISINSTYRIPSQMKKSGRINSKVISENKSDSLVHKSSIIKRIQIQALNESQGQEAKLSELINKKSDFQLNNKQILESQVIKFSKQQKNKSQSHIKLGASSIHQINNLHSNVSQLQKEKIDQDHIEDEQQLINLSAKILQPLQEREQSLRKLQMNSQIQSNLDKNLQEQIIAQVQANQIQVQRESQTKQNQFNEMVLKQKQFSLNIEQKLESKYNKSQVEDNPHQEVKDQISKEIQIQKHYSGQKQLDNSYLKQKMSNSNCLHEQQAYQSQQQEQKEQVVDCQLQKVGVQNNSSKHSIQDQSQKKEDKGSFTANQAQKEAYKQQPNSINNIQPSNIENEKQKSYSKSQSIKKSEIKQQPTFSNKIASLNEGSYHISQQITNLSSKYQVATLFQSNEVIKEQSLTLKNNKVYLSRPKIFNTFTQNNEFEASQNQENENYVEYQGKQDAINSINQMKLKNIQREKLFSYKDRQYATGRKKDKYFLEEDSQKQTQIERIKLLKQAQKKRLQRELQKVKKQLEEINYKEKRMDKIYEEKNKIQMTSQKGHRTQARNLSRNQERHKRQSEDVMKMMKQHNISKLQQQKEFQGIDRNITNNLMELNRIRQEAEEKLKEKKRLQIVDRMKKKQLQKMNQIKQLRANEQYIQQFKSVQARIQQKIKSPYKQMANNIPQLNEKKKNHDQQHGLNIFANPKTLVKVSRQQKQAKVKKIVSIGKKMDEDRYENRLS